MFQVVFENIWKILEKEAVPFAKKFLADFKSA